MRALIPFGGPLSLRREMDRLFDRFFEGEVDVPALGEFMPTMDLKENTDKVTVTMEVPGVDAKDVEVSVSDHMLTVKGEKKQGKEEKGEHSHRIERSYGAFARTIALPAAVDTNKADATFKNGVLTITVAKTPGAKGKTVPVKAAA